TDPDAGAGQLQINLKAVNGQLTLGSVSNLSFSLGDGTDDVEMTFTGTIADINAALDGTGFTPTPNYLGAASITMTSNDQGNTGSGGAKTDTDTLNINVVTPLHHILANGTFTQDWSNTGLITSDNDWSGVLSIRGFRGDNLAGGTGVDPQTIVKD